MSDTNNKPVTQFRTGLISMSVFENERQTREGEVRTYSSPTLQRSYKDKNNEWQQQTMNLDVNDLPKAILILQKTYEAIMLKQADQ